ncbi:MAG: 4Fe-4S dicluster domain-containing protein [Clostridiales bacterium]|nr:4Fe-4S dicluster domain-containing protein [Clostridiales bacterium]
MAYLGENIKKLGFGLMRLPMKGNEVDIEQTKQMVDLFMKKGFTYFDTAYGYIDGKSEEAVKTALVDRYPRESFQLATKMPAWAGVKTAQEARQMFYTSLERTGAGYFDFYLLHNLGKERTKVFDDFNIWDFVAQQKEKGLIKHYGFSFHDKADALDLLLKKHPQAEFVQLQINYADWENESIESRKCYEVARKHNKPIIIMEPVKGGSLADLPDNITKIFKNANPEASLASWAIRFSASLDGLITVLSGMSNIQQVEDNTSFMENFELLNDGERKVITLVQRIMANSPQIPCTDCRYCIKGCPQGIVIPSIFVAMNNYMIYNNLQGAKRNYFWETKDKGKASECIECGQCEAACPQQIHIINELKKAAQLLENG